MHIYNRIGSDIFSIEVEGRVIGYVSRRPTTKRGGSHWSIKRTAKGEWIGRYECRKEARMALQFMNSLAVVTAPTLEFAP